MKKTLIIAFAILASFAIGMNAQASTTVTFSGSEGKMFAPNCFCKEDVKPYKLAPWCEAKNSCNGESNQQSANVADGDYRVKINLGGLTDSQKFEVAIVTINGRDYTIPDQGGNGSSTGTAVYDLGSLHLSGTVSFKARHKYANTFTGKWYDSEASKIGSGNAMESISVDSIVLQGNTPPPPPPPTPTNGACGTRSISFAATATDWLANTTFCSAGTPSPTTPAFPAQGGTTRWTCNGVNGGSTATCQATRAALIPNNAACGTGSTTFSAQTTDWPANATFCATGSPTPASPLFPSQGEETKWTCNGTNNGNDITCKAKRDKEDRKPEEPEDKDEDEKDDCKGEIGNYVWLDSDRDGVQDDSEKGIDGIHMKLTSNSKTYRTTTNSKGRYSFEDLCEGDYVVTVKDEDVDGYTQTFDPDGLKNNKADVELKNDHDSDMSIDFGYAGKRVVPVTGSGDIAIYVSILLTLITFITYKKIRANKIA